MLHVTPATIAVIGIGQSLRGDDAVGLEAIRQWRENSTETASRPEVRVEACELPGLGLLDLFAGAEDVILIDAVQSGSEIGRIHRIGAEELMAFESESKSAHGWGVAETLKLARQLEIPLPRIRLIGIEARQMDVGAGLSAEMESALDNVCRILEEEIQKMI